MKKIILGAIAVLVFVPSIASAAFDTNLRYGSKGKAVKELQEFLADQGLYSGPISGNFFTLTFKAVKAFQKAQNIKPISGYFGPATRKIVNNLLDQELAQSNLESVNDTPIAQPKTSDAVVVKKDEQTYVASQPAISAIDFCRNIPQNQTTIPLGMYRSSDGDCFNLPATSIQPGQTTTPSQTLTITPTPTPILKKPYLLSEIPENKRLVIYPHYQSIEIAAHTTSISSVTFNGSNVVFPVPANGSVGPAIVNSLEAGKDYAYAWTYKEDGREDSVFTGTVKTKNVNEAVTCSGQRVGSAEWTGVINVTVTCVKNESNVNITFTSLELTFAANGPDTQSIQFVEVRSLPTNTLIIDLPSFVIGPRSQVIKSIALPATDNLKISYQATGTSLTTGASANIGWGSKVKFIDNETGVEYTVQQ